MTNLVHASVFSGIGGFDIVSENVGWTNAFTCEIDPFCRRVLSYYWKNVEHYEDIKQTDFRKWRGKIDILSGGFPCQPFSVAGSRKGATDDRYLWPEMLRAIRESQPTWVVCENVAGIISMVQPGEITKMERQGSLFEEDYSILEYEQDFVIETICYDLESLGYSVQPLIIPACAVGAPHRRDRIWIIAHSDNNGLYGSKNGQSVGKRDDYYKTWENKTFKLKGCSFQEQSSTNTNNKRLEGIEKQVCFGEIKSEQVKQSTRLLQSNWQEFPTQSPICNGNDGILSRLDGITFPEWRKQSIKAGGNAIVPQVAYEIFKSIDSCYE